MEKKILIPVLFVLLFSGILFIGLVLGVILLTPKSAVGQGDPGVEYTQAYQTIESHFHAAMTDAALETIIAQVSSTPGIPLETPTPTNSDMTAVITLSPTITQSVPVSNPAVTLCNQAQYVTDVTIPDNTKIQSNASFTKTWRIKNVGTCNWTSKYSLVFVSGDAMTKTTTISLPSTIKPGDTVDLSANLVAPANAGIYRGNWMLRTDAGVLFGIGSKADGAFWVQIQSTAPVVKVTPNPNFAYDFAARACEAQWRSGTGNLDCPGGSPNSNGFVQLLKNPVLENKHENEPAIWIHPNHAADGWISGTFPGFTVKENDHFVAWVGCLEDNQGCKVTFRLDYKLNDKVKSLGSWQEVYDGRITKVDVDLTALAGKKVQFILYTSIDNKQYDNANAFWFVPGIYQIKLVPTPTATATLAVPTATATQDPASPAEQSARQQLAANLGIGLDVVHVVSTEAVEWQDSCLGTQQQSCLPATISGYKIIFEANGSFYEAHTNEDGSTIFWM